MTAPRMQQGTWKATGSPYVEHPMSEGPSDEEALRRMRAGEVVQMRDREQAGRVWLAICDEEEARGVRPMDMTRMMSGSPL